MAVALIGTERQNGGRYTLAVAKAALSQECEKGVVPRPWLYTYAAAQCEQACLEGNTQSPVRGRAGVDGQECKELDAALPRYNV